MVKMIVDNFMYNNDSELLELRYHLLKDVVDIFVVSEANHTFTGIPKPYYAKKHVEELGLNKDKFIFLEVDTSDNLLTEHPMDIDAATKVNNLEKVKVYSRLRHQKDALMSIINNFPEETIFIIGDVDEMPKPDAVKYLAEVSKNHPNNILKVPLILLESRADRRVYDSNDEPVEWRRSQAFCTKKQVQDKGPSILRAEWEPSGGTFKYHPIGITENGKLVKDLGWHFTWMGSKEKKLEKAKSCAHATALHMVNNLSNESKAELSIDLNADVAKEFDYHLKPFDTNLLPSEIFNLPKVKNFLLPDVENHAKLVDYFMYFNEKELLELRYHMLKNYVDLFVISESNMTFSGQKKNYNLENIIKELNLDRKKIKIIYNDISNLTENDINHIDLANANFANDKNVLAWTRERIQRDAITKILNEFSDDCVFIISDIDEIVKPDSIEYLARLAKENPNVLLKVPLVLLESRADKRIIRQNGTFVNWDRSLFFTTKHQLSKYSPNTLRGESQSEFKTAYITENHKRVEDLGWHFTWMGDSTRQITKATNYGHFGNLSVVNTLSKETWKNLSNKLGKEFDLKTKYDLTDYDISNLPKEIFERPNVKKFLLPDESSTFSLKYQFDNEKLLKYVDCPNDPMINFQLGYEYEKFNQIAAAVSFYLRAAERTEDVKLQYECFLRLGKCFQFQKNRNFTVTGLFTRAITLNPTKVEAYYQLANHYLQINDYQNAYLYSIIGTNLGNQNSEFITTFDFEDIIDLYFIQAVAGWYVGFYKQSKDWLKECYNKNYRNGKYNKQIEKFFVEVIKENVN